jgi:Ca-activated chloride channel family protein
MSPLRRSRAARSPSFLTRAPLALLSLILACSSAGTGENDITTSVDPGQTQSSEGGGDDSTTGKLASGDESSGYESAGGESSSSDSADPSGSPPPEAPEPEPGVQDVVESSVPLAPGCDLEQPLQLQLRTLDAAAASSPAQARDAVLGDWVSLTGIGIRAWEFFNYYTFDYPAAAQPGAVVITPGLRQDGDDYVLQIGVRTHLVAADARPPVRLTLALDNSGSMEGKALELVRATGKAIAASLRAGDTVSIVTWNPADQTILDTHPVSGPDDAVLLSKLDKLEVGGSAELYSGLAAAYKLAEAAHDPTAWNHVVLVSDGGASVDSADLEVIASHTDIDLTGVGVGDAGIYRSDLMDAVAHTGRGASLFIGSHDEAARQFGDRFVPLFGGAVRDIVVRVELPPGFELLTDDAGIASDTSLGAPNVHLGPGDALVVHRRLRSCAAPAAGAKLTVKVQYVEENSGEPKEVWSTVALSQLLAEDTPALRKGVAVRAYADALTHWQASPSELSEQLQLAKTRLEEAQKLLPSDIELAEISAVLAVLTAE